MKNHETKLNIPKSSWSPKTNKDQKKLTLNMPKNTFKFNANPHQKTMFKSQLSEKTGVTETSENLLLVKNEQLQEQTIQMSFLCSNCKNAINLSGKGHGVSQVFCPSCGSKLGTINAKKVNINSSNSSSQQ